MIIFILVPTLHPCVHSDPLPCMIIMPSRSRCAYICPLAVSCIMWPAGMWADVWAEAWKSCSIIGLPFFYICYHHEKDMLALARWRIRYMWCKGKRPPLAVSQTKSSNSRPTPRHLSKSNQGQHLANFNCSSHVSNKHLFFKSLRFYHSDSTSLIRGKNRMGWRGEQNGIVWFLAWCIWDG